jgi:hypothetical protein
MNLTCVSWIDQDLRRFNSPCPQLFCKRPQTNARSRAPLERGILFVRIAAQLYQSAFETSSDEALKLLQQLSSGECGGQCHLTA